MKRIIFDVPRWNIYLHRRERKLDLVSKIDDPMTKFEDEMFDRLFSGESEKIADSLLDKHDAPWAKAAHDRLTSMGMDEIAAKCKNSATDSALATEWFMELIRPQVEHQSKPGQGQGQSGGQVSAEEAAQGMEHVGLGADDEEDEHEKTSEEKQKHIEKIAEMLREDERLKKIAELAGKFKRIVLTKQKSKIRHESDEISDIEQGGDIQRLLPSELVKFVSPRMKTLMMRDLIEKNCLQYSMTAQETVGRGPLILCVDKSSSMEGDKDMWASALGLALLDIAHRQRRHFILLGFDHEVFQKVVVKVGYPLPKEQLCVAPRGGTDIHRVLDLALRAVESKTVMHRADIILITDGESNTRQAEEIRERATKGDVGIFGIGIGVTPDAIKPWCDEAYVTEDMASIDPKMAEALFGK